MAGIPQEKLDILKAGPIDPDKALRIEDRNDLFKPGYLECETGYCLMQGGTGYLANLTHMPGVTTEMFEWWFAWHSLEDVRYMIWDPDDHFYARAQDRAHVLNENLPMRERTWGVTHEVLEDIGAGPGRLLINFKHPEDMGFEADKIGTEYCATIMAGDGFSPGDEPGPPVAAVMVHFVRETGGGIELRSRFWMGYLIKDGEAVKVMPDGVSMPLEAPMGLFAHNIKEYSNLAELLPLLYAEEKDNW
jgi:hypothetical protein